MSFKIILSFLRKFLRFRLTLMKIFLLNLWEVSFVESFGTKLYLNATTQVIAEKELFVWIMTDRYQYAAAFRKKKNVQTIAQLHSSHTLTKEC